MRHQAQKSFCGIFIVIPQHQKGYLVYVPITRKIIPSYDVFFDESFTIVLAYTSQTYSEAIAIRLAVTYTPCATSSREKTGNIIIFAHFEEGNILTKTRNNAESGDKSDDDSIIPPLINEEELDAMDYGDESYDEPMYTDMLEDISDGIHYHPNVNIYVV